jgi:site-specific recombinase XerD
MLERYFVLPKTVDRIRNSWLAGPIERYVVWLAERNFSSSSIRRRVSLILGFGAFAQLRGARHVRDLAEQVGPFVDKRLRRRLRPFNSFRAKRVFISSLQRPLAQMLHIVVPARPAVSTPPPLVRWAPHFFGYLREERGLRDATVRKYRRYLTRFEAYVTRCRIRRLTALTPAIVDGFLVEMRQRRGCGTPSLVDACAALRALFRFLFREGRTRTDLSDVIEAPRTYRLAGIPRSIDWESVLRTLKSIDRRSAIGRRDYAILLLVILYGLRAREVAALTLDDIDWRAATLHVRSRKAEHATSYPLAKQARDALVDYLKRGRPATSDRRVFFADKAPRVPVTAALVSRRCRRRLLAAGVQAPRLGSHTLRHSVAQRLVESDFSLKVVGDYLGHRSLSSTRVYTKVDIEALREIALGDGEQIL